jgi:proline dehydrogenase
MDMEGRQFVGDILRSALTLAGEGTQVTLALQVYLDRTTSDLAKCMDAGIRVRLVKGAYLGDTSDFIAIQERFRTHARTLISDGVRFSAASHDPVLVDWLKEERYPYDPTNLIPASADRTKRRWRRWKVV